MFVYINLSVSAFFKLLFMSMLDVYYEIYLKSFKIDFIFFIL